MEVRYLNTDLEIESRQSLARIIEEFGADVSVLHHGEIRGFQHASFEISGGGTGEADKVANCFCLLVENLPDDARKIWAGCCSRILDIGYESGTASTSFRSELRPSTVERLAKIGLGIVITIYPMSESSVGTDRENP